MRAENLTRAKCSDLEALHCGIESSEVETHRAEYSGHRAEGTTHEIDRPVKRRKFSLQDQIEGLQSTQHNSDEINRSKSTDLYQFDLN